MLPIINILLIVGILLFILYNLYVDTRNWSNTGSFLEGMENAGESINISVGNSNTNSKTVTLPQQNMTVSPIPINPEHEANQYGDTFKVSVSGDQLTVTRTDSEGGWGQPLVLKGTVGQNAPSSTAPSGFKYVTTGQPIEDISQEECKTFTDKLDGYSFNVINESGNPKGCMLQDGTPPGTKGVYYNTGGTADCGVFNGVSKCVVKNVVGAGSAETAMNNEVNSRAGNVAPMASSVPQNCKTGCIAPTGPNGNCKVIQKDGVEKRECYYGCPNPTMERNTENCAYDRDCNSCGTVLFNPDDPPDMGQAQQSMQMAQGQGAMAQGQMAQGQGAMAQGQGSMVQGGLTQSQISQPGSMENSQMDYNPGCSNATIDSSYSLFNQDIMKQVLAKQGLIPSDINSNNEETSFNSRIGKKFMIDTATIRNFALPNIDEQDYIELGRIVKKIKMIEKDPRDLDQVKALYSKLNMFVLELLTDSSLDMCGYDNTGIPKQINNKTRTTGMFGENSNSLIREKKQKVKPYNSIWSLYQ